MTHWLGSVFGYRTDCARLAVSELLREIPSRKLLAAGYRGDTGGNATGLSVNTTD